VSRPSPTMPPVAKWRVFTSMFAAPLAWIAQTLVVEAFAAQACFPDDRPLHAPQLSWLEVALGAVSLVCFAIGSGGMFVAWRTSRRMNRTTSRERQPIPIRGELDAFLARIAAMCSTMFMFGLVATDVTLMIVHPCGRW
jgi:hypothetical protein